MYIIIIIKSRTNHDHNVNAGLPTLTTPRALLHVVVVLANIGPEPQDTVWKINANEARTLGIVVYEVDQHRMRDSSVRPTISTTAVHVHVCGLIVPDGLGGSLQSESHIGEGRQLVAFFGGAIHDHRVRLLRVSIPC
jgi:hypothetical protein